MECFLGDDDGGLVWEMMEKTWWLHPKTWNVFGWWWWWISYSFTSILSPPFVGKCGHNAHFTIIYSNVPKKIEIELKIDSLRN